MTAELQGFLEQRKLKLELDISADIPELSADRGKLRHILSNLLTNAIRFTPDGGSIRCEAEFLQPDRFRMGVTDTGIGIAAGDLPHIFEPFYGTADVILHSSAGDPEFGKLGPGLGLSIVHRFAEMHAGKVKVASTQGKGSRFEVVLPIQAGPMPEPTLRNPNEPPSDSFPVREMAPDDVPGG